MQNFSKYFLEGFDEIRGYLKSSILCVTPESFQATRARGRNQYFHNIHNKNILISLHFYNFD